MTEKEKNMLKDFYGFTDEDFEVSEGNGFGLKALMKGKACDAPKRKDFVKVESQISKVLKEFAEHFMYNYDASTLIAMLIKYMPEKEWHNIAKYALQFVEESFKGEWKTEQDDLLSILKAACAALERDWKDEKARIEKKYMKVKETRAQIQFTAKDFMALEKEKDIVKYFDKYQGDLKSNLKSFFFFINSAPAISVLKFGDYLKQIVTKKIFTEDELKKLLPSRALDLKMLFSDKYINIK